jgi:acyl-CoA thioester hydrolase
MVKTNVRVLYGDTDQMGLVYYANYLRYFEAGRNEYLRARGARYRDIERDLGISLPVVEAHVEYKRPAHYDDFLVVETALGKVGRVSARFDYRVLRDSTLISSGHTVHACVDRSGKLHKLPARLLTRLIEGSDLPEETDLPERSDLPLPPAAGRGPW